jgi:hypothetical protein
VYQRDAEGEPQVELLPATLGRFREHPEQHPPPGQAGDRLDVCRSAR